MTKMCKLLFFYFTKMQFLVRDKKDGEKEDRINQRQSTGFLGEKLKTLKLYMPESFLFYLTKMQTLAKK